MKWQFVENLRCRLGASLGVLAFLAFVCTGFGQGAGKQAGERHVLHGNLPGAAVLARPVSSLPGTNSLRLAISLPLHNSDDLAALLRRLYDPASPDYRHYLTPAQFTESFGPTRKDYRAVINFAESNGLAVISTHDSRLLLDVRGRVSDIERAFHVALRSYKHPTESRNFYAPETQPWVDASLPILDVAGLSDYVKLRPAGRGRLEGIGAGSAGGSAPVAGDYMGQDFRNAYAPGVSLQGSGQIVGLFEADGYYAEDIANYEAYNDLPAVPLQNVLIDSFNGAPGALNPEVAADIEMAIAMAPGLSAVVVFESSTDDSTWIDILDQMASSNQIKQFSSSWGYTTTNPSLDPNTSFDSIFQKMAAQGQSFFQASGDGDAWATPIWVPADSPYVTSVGGTSLTMTGPGVAYSAEAVWNSGYGPPGWPITDNGYWGSGGGVSGVYPIPYWQQGVGMALNQGSITNRNIPDVAMTATNIFITANNGQMGSYFGTSCSAPLWAGFAALINEQAANSNRPPVGFLNPAIYALGLGPNYGLCFHDITNGNNTNSSSPSNYFAASGYDLCTGWGTPVGSNLINALAGVYQPLITSQPASQTNVSGGSATFAVTANGVPPLAYQWQFDGRNIAGATRTSLLVANLVQASEGSYTVVITNQWGAVASSAAVLTVTQAIPIVTWANPAPITYGAALAANQLNATANVPGSFTYAPTNGSVLNAGANRISVLFTPLDTVDYSDATNTVSLIVVPAPLSVQAANANRDFGQPNPVFTGTILGLTNGDDITANYSCSATSSSTAGTYPIVPSLVDPNDRQTNYTVNLINGTLVVGHPAENFTWTNPAPIIYGTALTSVQLNGAVNVPGTYSYVPTNGTVLNTGTNTLSVIFTPTDTVDYNSLTDSVSLVVLPALLTVTGADTNRQYGQANPVFTGIIAGVTNSDNITVTYSCSATTASPVGIYAVVPGLAVGTDLTNYTITYANGTLTIDPAALTVAADNRTKTYGQAVSFTGTELATTGLVNFDIVTGVNLTSSGTVPTATVAGSPYAIVPSAAVGSGLGNYTITYVNGALMVNPAALNITAGNRTKTYGQTVTFAGTEFARSGLLNSDTVASVTLTSSAAVPTATVAGSPYAIVPSAAVGSGLGNYAIIYANGTLTVSPAALTITADNKTKIYGQTVTFAGTEFARSGLLNSDTVASVTLTSSGTAATATVAGSPYAIVPSAAVGSGLGNYAIIYANGTLTVSPAALTVTADNKTKTYGQTVTFAGTEFVGGGLLNSDKVTSVTLTSSGTAATATVAGSPYAIVPSAAVGSGLGNYAIAYANGTLTVSPAALTVTADNKTKTYGQTVTFTGTEFASGGLVNTDTVTGVTLMSSGATATATVAGSPYAIVPSAAVGIGLANYAITYANGTLTINPAALTITADNKTKIYGQTVTFMGTEFVGSGLLNSDKVTSVKLTSSGAAATATVAGSRYEIAPSAAVGSGLANYAITYSNGTITINPAALTIMAANKTKFYGQTATFTGMEFASSGLLNSDEVTSVKLTSSGAAATATVTGSPYAIVPSAAVGSGLANYTIAYVNGILTVTSAQPVIQSAKRSGNLFTLTWTSAPSQTYQIQYKTNLSEAAWGNLGGSISATNSTSSASDVISNLQKFYRVEALQ